MYFIYIFMYFIYIFMYFIYIFMYFIYIFMYFFYTPYPDGAVFAILLANASTPLLDRLLVFPSSARSTGACCPK